MQPVMRAPECAQAPPAAAGPLRLQVRLFAGLRDAMGWGERATLAAAGATPVSLWQMLGLAEVWPACSGGQRSEAPQGGGGSSQEAVAGESPDRCAHDLRAERRTVGDGRAIGAGTTPAGAPITAGEGEAQSPPGSLPAGIRVAINQRFARADAVLADGDEVAFLPPISGG